LRVLLTYCFTVYSYGTFVTKKYKTFVFSIRVYLSVHCRRFHKIYVRDIELKLGRFNTSEIMTPIQHRNGKNSLIVFSHVKFPVSQSSNFKVD